MSISNRASKAKTGECGTLCEWAREIIAQIRVFALGQNRTLPHTSRRQVLACAPAFRWQFELKDCALGGGGRDPDAPAVGFDDRTADRKPQSHPAGFRREQWVEDAL